MLKPITNTDESYWIRNLYDWAAGIDQELKIEHVVISVINRQRNHARIRYGPGYRWVEYVTFDQLCSSRALLAEEITRWGKLKNK